MHEWLIAGLVVVVVGALADMAYERRGLWFVRCLVHRIVSLLDEKRDGRGGRRGMPRWSATRMVILALATAEVYRLGWMIEGQLVWPEALFAATLAFALPVTWLMYQVQTGDIPGVLESFFSVWRRKAPGGGGRVGRSPAERLGGPSHGYRRPEEVGLDSRPGYGEGDEPT